jgi:nicotinamidase-related amidase
MTRRALLLIDFFNPLDFVGGAALAGPALKAARNTARLKARLRRARVPAIYANDNFGKWESDFSTLVSTCRSLSGAPGEMARLLTPQDGDLAILKPRHSAFYGTPLEFLLEELHVDSLVLTGLAADSCISATAHDAHTRKFKLWVPRDCVAAEKPAYARAALSQLERMTDASILSTKARARRRSGPRT